MNKNPADKTTDPTLLAGKTFNVTFQYRHDGSVNYNIVKPDLCFASGQCADHNDLLSRITQAVGQEAGSVYLDRAAGRDVSLSEKNVTELLTEIAQFIVKLEVGQALTGKAETHVQSKIGNVLRTILSSHGVSWIEKLAG